MRDSRVIPHHTYDSPADQFDYGHHGYSFFLSTRLTRPQRAETRPTLLTIIIVFISVTILSTFMSLPMYVCLCKGITDTQIRSAVQAGATSLRDVHASLGVASQCGKCGITARQIVRESLNDSAEAGQQLFYALT